MSRMPCTASDRYRNIFSTSARAFARWRALTSFSTVSRCRVSRAARSSLYEKSFFDASTAILMSWSVTPFIAETITAAIRASRCGLRTTEMTRCIASAEPIEVPPNFATLIPLAAISKRRYQVQNILSKCQSSLVHPEEVDPLEHLRGKADKISEKVEKERE